MSERKTIDDLFDGPLVATLVTVFEVMNEDNDGRQYRTGAFFESESEALERSKDGTWSGKGLAPKRIRAVKFRDGSIRVLGDVVITAYGTGELALKAEREAAVAKLTQREREILGIK